MTRLAERCHAPEGWHTEVYLEGEQLADVQPWLLRLPAVGIDHLGVAETARRNLHLLAEHGVGIKASGFGRLDFDPAPVFAAVHRANPQSLLFGTDLPGPRAPRPFTDGDLDLISRSGRGRWRGRRRAGGALRQCAPTLSGTRSLHPSLSPNRRTTRI